MASSKPHAHGDLSALLESGDFSDLEIICGEKKFKVHKAIVCSKSPVIRAAMTGDWKEASSDVLEIKTFDAATVERSAVPRHRGQSTITEHVMLTPSPRFLRFCYTGDYFDTDDQQAPGSFVPLGSQYIEAILHVLMIAMGDFYQVDSLKAAARTKFARCHLNWDKAGFLELAKAIYTRTPDSETYLRETICGLASSHSEDLKG